MDLQLESVLRRQLSSSSDRNGLHVTEAEVAWAASWADHMRADRLLLLLLPGGYLMSYENNNIEPTNVVIQLKLTQLVIIIDYPNINQNAITGQRTLMWITE